jgi:arginine N-succinyltransferase
MLEAEGLRYQNHVDIFDAGPVLECHINDLRTMRESVVVPVVVDADAKHGAADAPVASLVSNTSMGDFRVGVADGTVVAGAMRLSPDDAAALHVRDGDAVRVLAITKPKQR